MKLIKEETIPLKIGEKSQDIIIQDPYDIEDMRVAFILEIIENNAELSSRMSVADPHHGTFHMKSMPNVVSRPTNKIQIGTYGEKGTPLFLTYRLFAFGPESKSHRVEVTFFTEED